MSQYNLLFIHRDQPGAAQLFEVAIARVEAMSHRMGGNAKLLKEQTWELYAKASPLLGLWLAVNDTEPIGHCIANIQAWDGRLVAWINQVEMSTLAGKALKDTFLNAVEGWVYSVNQQLIASKAEPVREIMMVTRRGTKANFDHWSRHAGFDPYLTIYRREVKV